MSPRATRVCPRPGCPNLQPCRKHARPRSAPWSPGRSRAAQGRFRKLVLARDGFTCQRCGLYDPSGKQLRACHLKPFAAGGSYDPSNGVTRCKPCDKATDSHAR